MECREVANKELSSTLGALVQAEKHAWVQEEKKVMDEIRSTSPRNHKTKPQATEAQGNQILEKYILFTFCRLRITFGPTKSRLDSTWFFAFFSTRR